MISSFTSTTFLGGGALPINGFRMRKWMASDDTRPMMRSLFMAVRLFARWAGPRFHGEFLDARFAHFIEHRNRLTEMRFFVASDQNARVFCLSFIKRDACRNFT